MSPTVFACGSLCIVAIKRYDLSGQTLDLCWVAGSTVSWRKRWFPHWTLRCVWQEVTYIIMLLLFILPPVWFNKLRHIVVCRDDNIYSTGLFSGINLEPFWLHLIVFVMCLKTSKQTLLFFILKLEIMLLSC